MDTSFVFGMRLAIYQTSVKKQRFFAERADIKGDFETDFQKPKV
jgi:hypothetical protein